MPLEHSHLFTSNQLMGGKIGIAECTVSSEFITFFCFNNFTKPMVSLFLISSLHQVTTMSLSGNSYIMVNTSRDEGYDISFRFKTTLPSGLLALGSGPTYYILKLAQGRLNLHSSLLNKWEGVFIGSQLNDSNWHKVRFSLEVTFLLVLLRDYSVFEKYRG